MGEGELDGDAQLDATTIKLSSIGFNSENPWSLKIQKTQKRRGEDPVNRTRCVSLVLFKIKEAVQMERNNIHWNEIISP